MELIKEYTATDGTKLALYEDEHGFYMSDASVGWDKVLFGEKACIDREEALRYTRNTLFGHHLSFTPTFGDITEADKLACMAQSYVNAKKAEGWTQADFAKALHATL